MEYFIELLNILNAMSPYLLLGLFVAGFLHVYLPKSTFNRYLSAGGTKSVILAALLGIPLPLCSCGVIPTAMSLKKDGASNGATVSFLIATPQTGVDSILATYGVFGLPFAIIRPVVALVVALFGGVLTDRFSGDGGAVNRQQQSDSCDRYNTKQLTIVDLFKYGFVEMLQDLGKWLTIGLLVAAAITVFVPDSLFELFSNYYLLNILVVLLLSIPMYICSTGSIPIAVSLLMKGISPGAALIFLMAGPATNVATLAVLRKVLGVRVTLLYLVSIVVGAIAAALFIDLLLPVEWFVSTLSEVGTAAHGGAKWWQSASSVIFVALLVNAYILKLLGKGGHSHDVVEPVTSVDMQRFSVQGMRCNHCKANVERAVMGLTKVTSAEADLATGVIDVKGEASAEEICSAVKQLGFEIESCCE